MKKEIVINDIHFNTQKDAIETTRKILLELEYEREIRPAIEGWDYLNALIKRHPDYESKKGKGIDSIVIKRDYNNNIAIDLKRVDGRIEDISWIYCVKSQAASPKQNLISAMRYAVIDQIGDFKRNARQSSYICGICGKPILPSHKMHVHHQVPFAELAEVFIKDNDQPPTQFDDDPITHQAKFTEASNVYSKCWQTYHREHAILVASHSKCNLSQGKKYTNEYN